MLTRRFLLSLIGLAPAMPVIVDKLGTRSPSTGYFNIYSKVDGEWKIAEKWPLPSNPGAPHGQLGADGRWRWKDWKGIA